MLVAPHDFKVKSAMKTHAAHEFYSKMATRCSL